MPPNERFLTVDSRETLQPTCAERLKYSKYIKFAQQLFLTTERRNLHSRQILIAIPKSTNAISFHTCAVESTWPDPLVIDLWPHHRVQDLLLLLTVVDLLHLVETIAAKSAPEKQEIC